MLIIFTTKNWTSTFAFPPLANWNKGIIMDEMKQMQDEYEQQLAHALDDVAAGYVTERHMAIIRHACVMTKKTNNSTFNFDEIFEESK